MGRYLLGENYRLRGWQRLPFGVVEADSRRVHFLPKEQFMQLYRSDGAHELPETDFLREMLARGILRPAAEGERLCPEQKYREYPARYKASAQWSVTGRCNFRCAHCLMAAGNDSPELSFAQCREILRQLAECGVQKLLLTGGEPLLRRDFRELADECVRSGILLTDISTNGSLLDAGLLDFFEGRGLRPRFQISFDGAGRHDRMRGVPGAEKLALDAFRLCRDRGFQTTAAMCADLRSLDSLGDTVRLLAQFGCGGLKVDAVKPAGRASALVPEDAEAEFAAFARFVPEFFALGAPMNLMLGGCFAYDADSGRCHVPELRGGGDDPLLCRHVRSGMYIDPEGRVLPCMSFAGLSLAESFPSIFDTPLRDILGESGYMALCELRLRDYAKKHPECADCPQLPRCCGGCRGRAVGPDSDDYLQKDGRACRFFRGGWDGVFAELCEKYGK